MRFYPKCPHCGHYKVVGSDTSTVHPEGNREIQYHGVCYAGCEKPCLVTVLINADGELFVNAWKVEDQSE